MMRDLPLALPRRTTLLGLGSVFTLGRVSLALASAPTEKRFVVVILRGALDGLAAVPPYGDPGFAALRPEPAPPAPGQDPAQNLTPVQNRPLFDLGGKFGLHPALARSHAMYQANELLVVHAVSGNYRVRSHFEAQDYLESGADHRMTSGWLNRAVAAMPAAAKQGTDGFSRAIAIGASVPLLLRGSEAVANWAPHGFAEPQPTLYQAILALNRGDPVTGPAIMAGLRDRGFGDQVTAVGQVVMGAGGQAGGDQAGRSQRGSPRMGNAQMGNAQMGNAQMAEAQMGDGPMAGGEPPAGQNLVGPGAGGAISAGGQAEPKNRYAFPALATAAGEMLKAPGGPRIAALELGGWDTHTAQNNRLVQPLTQLDAGLDALKIALGDAWRQTVVLVMTEFGRTARMNGTNGTDHGTATVAFVAGGAIAGGRVVADWPGLSESQLLENRDLAPTADIRSLAMGLLSAHLGLSQAALAGVFPGQQAQPMRGLVRTT